MRLLATLFSVLLGLGMAQADLTLTPARLEWNLPAGSAAEDTVTISNALDREEPLSVRLEAFALDRQGNLVSAADRSLCDRLEITPRAFTLAPRGHQAVRIRVQTAPQGEGTLACLVVFSGQPRVGGQGGLRLALRPELGLAVYLTLAGTERPALRASVGGEGKELRLALENPGNVLQRLEGEVRVFDPSGDLRLTFPLEPVPVFPGALREVRLTPPASLPPGRYQAVLLLQSPYGRYAAEGTWSVP